MNRLITTLLLTVLLLAANSCDRNYLGPDQQEIDSDDFFSNEDAFDRGALGIYQKLVFFYNYRGNAGNWLGLMRWLPDDDCTTQANRAYEIFQSLNAADGLASSYYQFAYQLIARVNTFLEKQDQLGDEVYNSQALRETHRGEALFLRGYMNFWLWNYFGAAAPLINDRITSQDGFFPASSEGNQLLDQAIADLDAAKDLLPDSWPEAEIGRATRNSANGYLGRALLYRATVTGSQGDYTAAIQAFDRIQGASLMADFGDNFDETIENNAESIFEVQLGRNEATDNVWLSNDEFNVVGEISGYWGHFDNNFGQFGQARITVTDQLVSIFEAEDPRIEDTFEPGNNNVKKYVARPRTNGGNPNFYNNHRDLRYADVLLMKAEAIVQSGGNIPEAIGLVNQIRERARNSADSIPSTVPADLDVNVGSASEALDIIVEERRRELAVEGLRWFDLRRWHLGGIINIGDINFDSVRDDFEFDPAVHIYFPLPASQVTDNPNLVQNPGY